MHDLDLILTLAGGLSAALVLGYGTHRLGLSPIVGYLLAGTIVGPHTPGFVADVGMAEQHGVGLGAGLALAGYRPICAIYSTFLQRAYDQVFQEVALQNLPVVFALDRAGLVGKDGPTHNGVFDIAYLRTLPNLTLAAPRDATDLRRMLELLIAKEGKGE